MSGDPYQTLGVKKDEQGFYRDSPRAAPTPYTNDAGFADFAGSDDLLSELFGRGGRGNFWRIRSLAQTRPIALPRSRRNHAAGLRRAVRSDARRGTAG